MAALQFEYPAALWLLAFLPPGGFLWVAACRRVGSITETIFRSRPRGNTAAGGLRLLALGLLTVALAGPVWLGADARPAAQAPLIVVLDVSASMRADDVPPDRLSAAQRAVRETVSLLPAEAPLGLVVVASGAAPVCPPTTDRDALLSLLARARPGWMGSGGSDLAAGLRAAAGMLQRETAGAGVVLLVSDGENRGASPVDALAELTARGATVHTLTVGTATGALIHPPGAAGVISRARPGPMAHWAASGAGRSWAIAAESKHIPASAGELVPRRVTLRAARAHGAARAISPWLYAAAALAMAASFLWPRRLTNTREDP